LFVFFDTAIKTFVYNDKIDIVVSNIVEKKIFVQRIFVLKNVKKKILMEYFDNDIVIFAICWTLNNRWCFVFL
jgi:hypothetical protein